MKKGFTLIELLAVIIILAILMIIAIPNILNTLGTARKKTFITQAQSIYKTAEQQFIINSMNNKHVTIFTDNGENNLDLSSKSPNLKYYVKLNGTTGKVEELDLQDTGQGFKISLTKSSGNDHLLQSEVVNATIITGATGERSIRSENGSSNNNSGNNIENVDNNPDNNNTENNNNNPDNNNTENNNNNPENNNTENNNNNSENNSGESSGSEPLEPASLTCTNKTYNGSEQVACTCSGGTIGGDYKAINVGNYTASCVGDENHLNPENVNWEISPRTVTVTAPTVKSDALTYNGGIQYLLQNGGSCSAGGTMYWYSSNPTTSSTMPSFSTSSGWTTVAPYSSTYEAVDPDTYYIYYYCYVSDTTNNTGININTVGVVSKTIYEASTINNSWRLLGELPHCGNECASDCRYKYGDRAYNSSCIASEITPPLYSGETKGRYCWCLMS